MNDQIYQGNFVSKEKIEPNPITEFGKEIQLFPLENTDNSDFEKDWNLGIEYWNKWGEDWRICLPRKWSNSPLKIKIVFRYLEKGIIKEERIYPSCSFQTLPNRLITISEGCSYKLALNLDEWRNLKDHPKLNGCKNLKYSLSFSVEYEHSLYPAFSRTLEIHRGL